MIVPSVLSLLESVHGKGNINCAVRNSIVLEFCDLEFIGASVFEFSHGIRQSHAFNFLCMMVFFSDVIKYVKCSDFFIPSYKIRNPWFVDFSELLMTSFFKIFSLIVSRICLFSTAMEMRAHAKIKMVRIFPSLFLVFSF